MMEELLANIEQQLHSFQVLDVDDDNRPGDTSSDPTAAFESLIKINGKPIPPPVMTRQKRLEMRELRNEAVQMEQQLANQRKLKLLEKVQSIVNGIEERRSLSQASQVDDQTISTEQQETTSPKPSDWPAIPDEPNYPHTETVNHNMCVEHPALGTSLSSVAPELGKAAAGISSAQGSTSSSSEASVLNQTVVAASDFSPTDQEHISHTQDNLEQNKSLTLEESRCSTSLNADAAVASNGKLFDPKSNIPVSGSGFLNPAGRFAVTKSLESEKSETYLEQPKNVTVGNSLGLTAGVKLACSWNQEGQEVPMSEERCEDKHPPLSRFPLMPRLTGSNKDDDDDDLEPFGERETYLSLLGEYSSLPMPVGSSHFFSDVSAAPSSTPLDNPSPITIERPSELSGKNLSVVGCSNEASPKHEESSVFISTSSTLLTNTAGLSCTLPSSLRTVSAASTLLDVDDPWNTLLETPLPTNEDFQVHPVALRGTPVGQEDSHGSNPTSATKTTTASPDSGSSENEFISPEKRVRRNSYTLDHPSPALLNAQARNEAPHANVGNDDGGSSARRSLEFTNNKMEVNSKSQNAEVGGDTASIGQKADLQKGLSEDIVLQQQLQHFEEMRLRLEQQQREQLQQLLMEQQRAQMALQQEMAQIERHFIQKQQQQQQQRDRPSSREKDRASNKEDVARKTGVLEESQGKVSTLSPASVSSNKSTPTSAKSSPCTAPYVPSNQSSPPSLAIVTPDVQSTNKAGSGGQTEPFFLGGDASQLARLPGVGKNVATPVRLNPHKEINSPQMKKKFDKISAVAKGYLTRQIFKTHRVQSIIQTIKDTVAFADKFISETPVKKGGMTMQDMMLAERVLAQVRAAQYDLYDIFFTLPIDERMSLLERNKRLSTEGGQPIKVDSEPGRVPAKPLSAATVKALERKKKAKEAEARIFGGDVKSASKGRVLSSRSRPVSAADGRILRPLVSQRSPARPASTNTYRPSKYGIVITHNPPKPKDSKNVTHDLSRAKVTAQKAPGNVTQGVKSTKTRSPVTVKPKGVRRSLYPIANPAKKAPRRNTDVRK